VSRVAGKVVVATDAAQGRAAEAAALPCEGATVIATDVLDDPACLCLDVTSERD
jgi:hypothetical protein